MNKLDITKMSRRELIKLSLMCGAAIAVPGSRAWAQSCSGFVDQTPHVIDIETGLTAMEVFPTSPFILSPFTDSLPIPTSMLPGIGSLTARSLRTLLMRGECGRQHLAATSFSRRVRFPAGRTQLERGRAQPEYLAPRSRMLARISSGPMAAEYREPIAASECPASLCRTRSSITSGCR